MDPLSLIAMASTTFKGIQTLIERGAEIEHVAQKLDSGTALRLTSDKQKKKLRVPASSRGCLKAKP